MLPLFRMVLIAAVLLVVSGTARSGTYFYLKPDKKVSCKGDMPESFSIFLEGEDAWGDYSDYHRVCGAAAMRLDLFKDCLNASTNDEASKGVLGIDSLLNTMLLFQTRLNPILDLQKVVDYDPRKNMQDSLQNALISKQLSYQEFQELSVRIKQLDSLVYHDQTSPYYLLPGDSGYISKGWLVRDVRSLIALLKCYKKAGVKTVIVEYM